MEWIAQFEQIAGSQPVFAVFLSFWGGVLASFTPCTYPMLPITVAFIGDRSHGSKQRGFLLACFYVLGMALVYAGLGVAAALSGQIFGQLTANWWTYLIVGNIFLFFGLVMLDAMPLSPPACLNRFRINAIPGHDFLTSALLGGASATVISTCTAPILGVLLTIVATRQNVALGFGMLFAFAYGLGALVIVIGTFTGLLASLPRSGVWMRRVQRGFGLLMIVAAEYLLIKAGEMWI